MKTFIFIVFFILGVVGMLTAWWLSGFDFNTRGDKAVGCYVMSLAAGLTSAFASTVFYAECIQKK